jgi:hypothetical protein
MTRPTLDVTFGPEDAARVPDCLLEGVAVLASLLGQEVLEDVGEKVQIRRQGGFCGLDVWLFLWLYFSSGLTCGLRKFWKVLGPVSRLVGPVMGRKKLPSPASVSRALDSVEHELLRPRASWLLAGVAGIDELLGHPVVQSYDANGEGWHVFDVDPTVTTLRHRALPSGEDLPAPRRRSEHTGAPGYSGRKRGDIQFRRVTTQHAGSGAWVHAHLAAGNGDGVVDLERALDAVAETVDRVGHTRSRVLVRMDGEYGNVPWFTACRERKLPFITRLNRPALYEDPDVLARLRAAIWRPVPDSRSGPQRAATDLGVLTVLPGKKTRRPDGTTYEPVTVRVVAAIFPKSGAAKRGRTIDGWQVELFAVDLPADAWPAADAMSAYFGRAGEENRFAQEDREFGLDRIISYHLPGQELATLVGLSVWNLRLVRGFQLERPPEVRPVQQLRRNEVDERVPQAWPRDPVLQHTLEGLDWNSLLQHKPGWRWDTEASEIHCADGRPMTLTSVRPGEHASGRTGIIFRRPTGGCDDCTERTDCFHSNRPGAAKHAQFAVPTALAADLRERLVRVRTAGPSRIAPVDTLPGKRAVLHSLFLPASARQAFGSVSLRATVHIQVELPDDKPVLRLVARDDADRQRRRCTRADNMARFALPDGAKVLVQVQAAPVYQRLWGDTGQTKTAVGDSS